MNNIRFLMALAAMGSIATAAVGQSTTVPSRADVKAEAREAVSSGTTAEGEIKSGGASAPTGRTVLPRTSVKEDAKAAVRSGTTAEGEIKSGGASAPTGRSNRSREDVKSSARAAVKKGTTAEVETTYGPEEKSGAGSSAKSRR